MSADCICPLAGFCERHQITKNGHLHRLCQEREDYRQLWDSGLHRAAAVETLAAPASVVQPGPGSHLHRLLGKLGLQDELGCPCKRHIGEMNAKGPQWCRENLATIVEWLREESDRRAADHAIRLAEYQADPSKPRPEGLPLALRLPFSETAARQLVLLAIRRAEWAK